MAGELKPRILRLSIAEDFAGKTIKEYLMKQIGFSSRQLSRFKYRKDGILLNGERRYVNYILKAGDVLEIRLTQGGEPAKEEMRDTCLKRAGGKASGRNAFAFRGEESGEKTAGSSITDMGFKRDVSLGAESGEDTSGGEASSAGSGKDNLTDRKHKEAAGLYFAARDGRLQKIWFAPAAWLAEKYPLHILYEDQDILAADKPPGVVCHPSPGHFEDTLSNQVAEHLGRIGQELDVRVTGRLDKDTSGIVIFALNTETAAQLIKQRRDSMLSKLYIARVRGHFSRDAAGESNVFTTSDVFGNGSSGNASFTCGVSENVSGGNICKTAGDVKAGGAGVDSVTGAVSGSDEASLSGMAFSQGKTDNLSRRRIDISGTVDKPLRRKSRDSFLMITAPDGKAARTHYRALVEMEDGTTLVACRIEHGRTHQIRVHMSSIGHPLVGDRLYGIEAGEDDRDLFSSFRRFGSNLEKSRAERTGSSVSENGHSKKESGFTESSTTEKEQRIGSEKHEEPEAPLMLHAFRAELIQPFTGEKIALEAPLPEWAEAVSDIFV